MAGGKAFDSPLHLHQVSDSISHLAPSHLHRRLRIQGSVGWCPRPSTLATGRICWMLTVLGTGILAFLCGTLLIVNIGEGACKSGSYLLSHIGRVSSHLTRRPRQVKQPLRVRRCLMWSVPGTAFRLLRWLFDGWYCMICSVRPW